MRNKDAIYQGGSSPRRNKNANQSVYRSRVCKEALISILGCVILYTTAYAYRPALFQHSLEVIPKMQADIDEDGRDFFATYSSLGTGDFQVYFLFFLYVFLPDSAETLFFSMMISIQMLLITIFKTLLHNPRPFWANPDIKPEDCSKEWGDPSGHSFCAAYFMTYLYFRFIWTWAFGGNGSRDSLEFG